MLDQTSAIEYCCSGRLWPNAFLHTRLVQMFSMIYLHVLGTFALVSLVVWLLEKLSKRGIASLGCCCPRAV